MTENKTYPSQPLNWFLFMLSLPIALGGIQGLMSRTITEGWVTTAGHVIWVFLPLYFYTEIMKYRQGYSKISITTNNLFKCRVQGTEEVFYLRADSEQEAELFFETILEGKTVFIEESSIKLMGFEMALPNQKNET